MHFIRVAAHLQTLKLPPYFLIVDYCRVAVSRARTLVRLGMDLSPPPPAPSFARNGGGGVGQLVGGHHVPCPGLERLSAHHPHPPEVVNHGGVGGALGGHALSVRVILVFLVPPGDGLGRGEVFRQDLPVALGCWLGARVPWERRQLIREVASGDRQMLSNITFPSRKAAAPLLLREANAPGDALTVLAVIRTGRHGAGGANKI